jgi:uncharacterized DUF497 family protein
MLENQSITPILQRWNLSGIQEKQREISKVTKIAFEEAATVFGDPLSLTLPDPDHSNDESRFITVGNSIDGKLLLVSHTDRDEKIRIISVREATKRERKFYGRRKLNQKTETSSAQSMIFKTKRRSTGEYVKGYRAGTNLVLLAPDVSKAFPNEEAVNEALRLLMKIAQTQIEHTS